MSPTAPGPATDNDQEYRLVQGEDESNDGDVFSYVLQAQKATLWNFVLMSILFSANHGCVVACLALATAQLGATGAWQSGVLYLTYTTSALLGATYLVKQVGPRNALMTGMGLYCIYVACFWLATKWAAYTVSLALTGAAIGGIGAGCLWTAQGAYFSSAAEEHAYYRQREIRLQNSDSVSNVRTGDQPNDQSHSLDTSILSESTSHLAGIFAFLYLAEELVLRLLSTALLQFQLASWGAVFGIYTIVSIASVVGMVVVRDYSSSAPSRSSSAPPRTDPGQPGENGDGSQPVTTSTVAADRSEVLYKVTAAAQLLWNDPKMKYMIGLNAVFGLTSAFLNSYVNGQVVPVALASDNGSEHQGGEKYIGVLTSWVSMVAAVMSLALGKTANVYGKAPVLILGSICFIGVVVPFLVYPPETYIDNDHSNGDSDGASGASASAKSSSPWGWALLFLIYTFHGTGRATFESTLKAMFADYFPQEKEGAFANIILQNGLAGAVGYVLTFALTCSPNPDEELIPSTRWGCVPYSDGSYHDVGTFEVLCSAAGIAAIFGLIRASTLYKEEQHRARDRLNVSSGIGTDGAIENNQLHRGESGVST